MIDVERITDFVQDTVHNAGVEGVVLGVSGGIDSAVVLGLCLEALGKDKVIGVYMPDDGPSNINIDPGVMELAEVFEISINFTSIYRLHELFKYETDINLDNKMNQLAEINTKARIRMVILYAIANSRNLMVAGTSNKSELLTGYFTKYGDGGVDFEPIGHLWKTEIFTLAKQLGVPQQIIDRAPSADLYEGQTDEEELGMKYEDLDLVLRNFWENQPGVTTFTKEKEHKVIDMVKKSHHKRRMPPTVED